MPNKPTDPIDDGERPIDPVADFAKEDQLIQSHINAITEHPSESAALAYSLSSLIAQRRQRADSMIADLKVKLDEADRKNAEDSHAIALIRELHPKNDDQTYRNAVLEIIGNENRQEKPVCSACDDSGAEWFHPITFEESACQSCRGTSVAKPVHCSDQRGNHDSKN